MAPPSPETRDLARHLLAYEAAAGKTSEPTGSAAFRVYENLRRRLSALVGVGGFQSLASRALALAKPENPGLSTVQVTADGSLQGLGDRQVDKDEADEGGVIFIAQLLGLLHTFIGEALTLRLLQDVWRDRDFGNERKA